MGEFMNAPFGVRYSVMGDVAEGIFEKVMPAHHRLGLNRPSLHVASLPYIMRFLPDYLTTDGMVEVMGIGRDKTLKIKTEKLNNLLRFEMLCPVHLFVWDSSRKKWWLNPLGAWSSACMVHGEVDHFPDNGHEYIKLNSDNFPCVGVKFDGQS